MIVLINEMLFNACVAVAKKFFSLFSDFLCPLPDLMFYMQIVDFLSRLLIIIMIMIVIMTTILLH